MTAPVIDRGALLGVLARLDQHFARPGRVFLVGETSQLLEGWRSWVGLVELKLEPADPDTDDTEVWSAVSRTARDTGVDIVLETPEDIIPLPAGWRERSRPATAPTEWLDVLHFDPYSVSFRYIARGDEPDYHLVLRYLENGWIVEDEMERLLTATLPRFTSETIAQDPAEFRRRYKGLLQMWHTVRPGVTHRPTEA